MNKKPVYKLACDCGSDPNKPSLRPVSTTPEGLCTKCGYYAVLVKYMNKKCWMWHCEMKNSLEQAHRLRGVHKDGRRKLDEDFMFCE